jgi:asparagine synthase (glutamine-hydrolysing)
MCGIVALAGQDAAAPDVVERGIRAIAHRGPDGQGTWRAPDGAAALAHARLAIIDLSPGGTQPMQSRSGRTTITFNGEIFNYRELREQVRVPLRTASDTEVLLELLEQEGARALGRIRGMFAFAAWDGDELLVVRDRVGIKPLFYAEGPERLAVASEIAALLAMKRVDRQIDPRAIDEYLTHGYVPPPRTALLGCRELPPGHLLRFRRGRATVVERWWAPPTELSQARLRPEDLRGALDDAVTAHLVSDAPVGVFLSGGLDSSTLVALASRHYPGRLKTMCVAFGAEATFDERSYARDVADRYGTDHTELEVRAEVAAIVPELARHFGQPFGAPPAVLSYALSRAAAAHVKVALAGDGGDEILGGYPRYQGVQLEELVRRMPASLRAGVAALALRVLPAGTERGRYAHRWRRFAESMRAPSAHYYYDWVSYADAAAKSALLADRDAFLAADPPAEEYEFFQRLRGRYAALSMTEAAPRIDLESFLPCNVLAQSDRMSMAHGLEVRVPFCDHTLIETVGPVPLAQKLPLGVPKGLFRRAVARDLPASVLAHKKVGFVAPTAAWLRTDLREILRDLLSPSAVRARGLLRPSAVQELLAELDQGRSDRALTVWSLMILESWLRWIESQP